VKEWYEAEVPCRLLPIPLETFREGTLRQISLISVLDEGVFSMTRYLESWHVSVAVIGRSQIAGERSEALSFSSMPDGAHRQPAGIGSSEIPRQ